MARILRQALDRRDAGPGRAFERHLTRPRRGAVDMDSAGAALGDAAAIFRARHSQMVTQHPQQRRRWVGVDALVLPVDRQIVWHLINPAVNRRLIRYRHNRPNLSNTPNWETASTNLGYGGPAHLP